MLLGALCGLSVLVSCKEEQKEEKTQDSSSGAVVVAANKLSDNINSARCNEVPKNFKRIMDKSVEYEAMNGYWPSSIAELDLNLESKFWSYSLSGEPNAETITIFAKVKRDKKVGQAPSGAFIAINNEGDKSYSHPVLADSYMKAYLRGAQYVGSEQTGRPSSVSASVLKARCSEIPLSLRKLMDQVVVYEAEIGEWPTLEDIKGRGVNLHSSYFDFSLEKSGNSVNVVAKVKAGVSLGSIGTGEVVSINTNGQKRYSHDDFKTYLKAYLTGATKI